MSKSAYPLKLPTSVNNTAALLAQGTEGGTRTR